MHLRGPGAHLVVVHRRLPSPDLIDDVGHQAVHVLEAKGPRRRLVRG